MSILEPANPATATETVGASASTRLWGLDANVRTRGFIFGSSSFDLLGGYRQFSVVGALDTASTIRGVNGGSQTFRDHFDTRNQFYGGQIGATLDLRDGPWTIDLTGKFAVGGVHHVEQTVGSPMSAGDEVQPEQAMATLSTHGAGLDVHKETVVVCVRCRAADGALFEEVRTFATMTRDLWLRSDWLLACGVTPVAMESTGVYWKPVVNVLEGCFHVTLVHAQHIKPVPGRTTAVQDCQWMAPLVPHGLRQASFVPSEPIRELRDLTRPRTQLIGEKTSAANRIQKVLGDANVKRASVASAVLGTSGRDMLEALIAGETDPEKLAELARRQLRGKIPPLREALWGRVTEHHRFLVRLHLDHLTQLEELIARRSVRIEEALPPLGSAVERLTTIPGLNQRVAETVLVEIGPKMDQFPSAGHLVSWAGMSPGHNASAGKRRSGHPTKGNRWLKRILVQAAWAARRTKGTDLAAQYRRLAKRRGRQRALVAGGHTRLGIIYPVLKQQTTDTELGEADLDRLDGERLTRSLVKRLMSLGHKVTLEPAPTA